MRKQPFLIALLVATLALAMGYLVPVVFAGEPVVTTAARPLRLPDQPFNYSQIAVPAYAQSIAARFDNTPPDNPITDHGATLGRVLFYDPTLSQNASTSCASCHKQSLAFTDDRALSVGFDGRKVSRNSMSLINSRYFRRGRFFWDERAATLESQVLMPIENEIEMGHHLPNLVKQLAADPIYPPLFRNAFGDDQVNQDRMAKALAQFVRSIVSFGSRYDQGRASAEAVDVDFVNFTAEENAGKRLFFGEARCASCHVDAGTADSEDDDFNLEFTRERQSAFFFLNRPVVNGIDMEPYESSVDSIARPGESSLTIKFDGDRGVGAITSQANDIGRFKSPSLRCVEVTGPYMHDGRFLTIEAVVEHYNWSIRPHVNLDPRLQRLINSGIAVPQVEVDALVAFLKTLTDEALLKDPRYADPFIAADRDSQVSSHNASIR